MIEAQKKKPKVPVHALVTAHNPMVRFIGSDDMTQNRELFSVWIRTLPKWTPTATPYLFLHTPDIAQAPELVDTLWGDLRTALPEIGNAPSIPQQTSLSDILLSSIEPPEAIKGSFEYGQRAVCGLRCVIAY
ncbi:Uncharacterised protein [Klebsiella grimontii]|uniref:DUF72 domain-containing protein n=1 Tax=Klebsiella grimontii TaxID=2058152 RepID=A0A7H4P1A7_9ENTR|nr:Uncharacterised protein [Klebsiella grimontii]